MRPTMHHALRFPEIPATRLPALAGLAAVARVALAEARRTSPSLRSRPCPPGRCRRLRPAARGWRWPWGGAARGFAHVGVIEARVAGSASTWWCTSAGSVGALYASGMNA
jgi:hypothetical protein